MTSTQNGQVEFRFFRPNASAVALVGQFNGWRQDDLLMCDQGDGWWSIALDLEPGEYRFRYLADGQWHTDYAANGVERSKWGWNSILVVAPNAQATNDEQDTRLKIAA